MIFLIFFVNQGGSLSSSLSIIFSNFLTIPVVIEKIKVKLALAITTGAPRILVNEIIGTPLLVALKTIKILSCNQKQ